MVNIKAAEEEIISGLEDRSNVPVKFFYRSVLDEEETAKQGRPVYKNVEMLEKWKDKNNIHHKKATEQDKLRYPKQYEAFKNNEEQKLDGTPVDYLPAISPAQLDNLKACRVYTIEQLSEIGYSVLSAIGHGATELQTRAKEFLQQSSLKDAELKALSAKIAELENKLKEKENEPSNNSTKRNGRNANSGKPDISNK